jgi:2-polyprenyl-6-hydroxyphenyl methylase/3-demethylubiquinone-9 3-methyltransferase
MNAHAAAAQLSSEVQKFDALAHEFWDPRGAFHPLHALNPVRIDYIAQRIALSQRRVLDVGCGCWPNRSRATARRCAASTWRRP